MKQATKISEMEASVVKVDKSLNQYDDVTLFPEKVKKAKEAFAKFGLPEAAKKQ